MGNLDGFGLSDADKYAIALSNQQQLRAQRLAQAGHRIQAPPSAHIRADYQEFRPETFKGFTVDFSEEPGVTHGPFKTEQEAEDFAYSRVQKVYTMSSVDHYKQDLRSAGQS